jgi:RNA polymerase sigma factor (sigma-70 family)
VAWESLLGAYWNPLARYARLRFGLSPADAEDLTQDFLARLVERRACDGYDPERARFRTFLRLLFDRHVATWFEAAGRLKRGGATPHVSLDASPAFEPPDPGQDPEEVFHREWLRGVFERALVELRQSAVGDREVRFRIFERVDLGAGAGERPTYGDLAVEFSLPVTQITNHLAWARRELRRRVLEDLRAHTASEREFRAEARRAFGWDPP